MIVAILSLILDITICTNAGFEQEYTVYLQR